MSAPTSDLVKVEIARGHGPFDTAIPGGDWFDITADGRLAAGTITSGRGLPYGPFPPRMATFTVRDDDRVLDAFSDDTIEPSNPVRITLTANGNPYVRFYGFLNLDDQSWRHPEDGYVTFSATDQAKFVGRETNLGLGNVPEERTSDRFVRICDALGIPVSQRDIGVGSRYMAARELNVDATTALNACAIADGPMAAWFVTREGLIRFDGRHCYAQRSTLADIQATYSDQYIEQLLLGSFAAGRHAGKAVSEQTLFNKARITNASGQVYEASDPTSVSKYGPLRYPDVTIDTRTHPSGDAELIVAMFKDRVKYIRTITVDPAIDANPLEAMAAADVRDRIRVRYQRPGGGAIIDHNATIEQITETFGAGQLYKQTYQLFPTAPMDSQTPGDWWILGDATDGVLGTAAVGP